MSGVIRRRNLGDELFEILRGCPLRGDVSHLPYRNADMAVEPVSIDEVVPLAKYVLQDQLDYVGELRRRLLVEGLDILDLPGRVVWQDGNEERIIAPPIIELWDGEGLLLVDGLHRVWTARQIGMLAIGCVVIRGVTTPLVPRPTEWDNIDVYPRGELPALEQKREYRFHDASSLKAAVPALADEVNDENYRYFLFRNLDALGSTGVRDAADDAPHRGTV